MATIEDADLEGAMMLLYAFLLALGVVAVLAATRPVLFKMGIRNAARRKSQTALVVGGLMIGTAIMGGALLSADSLEYTIVEDALRTNDLLDITVGAPGNFWFNHSLYEELRDDPALKGETDAIAPAVYSTQMSLFDTRSLQTEPNVQLIGFDHGLDGGFGDFTTKGGTDTDGSDLGSMECIINERLAKAVYAREGDKLEIYYSPIPEITLEMLYATMGVGGGGPTPDPDPDATDPNATGGPVEEIMIITFTVKNIVRNEGKANMWGGNNIFVPLASAQAMYSVSNDRINMIKVSDNGGVISGLENTKDVKAIIEKNLDAKREAFDPMAQLPPGFEPVHMMLAVNTIKDTHVEVAQTSGEGFGQFLFMMSLFTVVTGVMLIINIFVMLAEERKSELGMARAVGMKRGDLMRMFLFEGVLYSIIAATLGVALGFFIGYGIVWGFNYIFGASMGTEGALGFHWQLSSVIISFALGGLITLGTIAIACFRVSKLNIVRAIRKIDEPVKKRGDRRNLMTGGVLIALGAVLSVAGIVDGAIRGNLQILGPNTMIIGMGLVMRAYLTAPQSFTSMGAAIAAYTMWGFFYIEGTGNEGMVMLVLAGVLLVMGVTIAVMFNAPFFVKLFNKVLVGHSRSRAIMVPAVSYPLNKQFRTGLTVSMFALIMFIVTLFSIFFGTFTPDVQEEAGDANIVATTTLPLNDIYNVSLGNQSGLHIDYTNISTKVDWIVGTYYYGFWGNVFSDGAEVPVYGPPYQQVRGIDRSFAEHMDLKFQRHSDEYETGEEALIAVATTPGLCLVDSNMAGTEVPIDIGSELTFPEQHSPTGSCKVVGIVEQVVFSGVYMNKTAMASNFTQVKGNTLFIIKTKDGEDLKDVARGLEADFRAVGMNTILIREQLEALSKAMEDMFNMFEIFLALGLVIGIASLAVLTVRAVVERRREIGIMRAIGYKKRMITATFMWETLFITTLGVVIGLLVGIAAGYGIYYTSMKDLGVDFTVPWLDLGSIIGLTYFFAFVFTALPSRRAANIPPAEAIRYLE